MSDTQPDAASELPPTPRLSFGASGSYTDVPAFLRGEVITPAAAAIGDPDAVESLPHQSSDYTPEVYTQETLEPSLSGSPASVVMLDEDSDEPAVDTAVVKLDELSVEQLREQQEEINRKIAEKQLAEKKDVINQIAAVMKQYGIPLEELVEAMGGLKIKRKGTKAKPKYQDPVSKVTWSGRGKEPAWIKGKNRAQFLIKS